VLKLDKQNPQTLLYGDYLIEIGGCCISIRKKVRPFLDLENEMHPLYPKWYLLLLSACTACTNDMDGGCP
jgi:hypothetical protein